MSKNPISVFNEFVADVDALASIAKSVVENAIFSNDEKSKLIEGIFVKIVTSFESHTEKLFFGLLEGRYSRKTIGVTTPFSVNPVTFTRNLLLVNSDYFEWLPIERTIERAESVFVDGLPFSKLKGTPLKGELASISKIRNAIAHSSNYAQDSFQKAISQARLLPSEKTPGGYLLSMPGSNSSRQVDIICTNMKAVFNLWCKP